jgi:hypothetical protein
VNDLSGVIKFGVAGNMAGHLEQAGEASDFVAVTAAENAPKGLFPWHVPGAPGMLGANPVSADTLRIPAGEERVQQEPELALLCDLVWQDSQVVAVKPVAFAAYNDASIRKAAPKISFKKNWGRQSKGVGNVVRVDGLAPGGTLDHYRLASFLLRDGQWHAYGDDTPVVGYGYVHQTVLDWMVDRFNSQADNGPLEDLPGWLAFAGRPPRALIGIGATCYTDFGASHMLQAGDESVVVAYDGRQFDPAALREWVKTGTGAPNGMSVLRQTVVEAT